MYVGDNGEFPLMITFLNNVPEKNVVMDLYPYLSTLNNQGSIYVCPDYQKLGGISYGNHSAYGYNASGCDGWKVADKQLGLDAMYTDVENYVVPLKESGVVSPSQMISWGDSVVHYDATGNKAYGSMDLSSGLQWIKHYYAQNSEAVWDIKSYQFMSRRHSGKVNISYCDGHVEFAKPTNIFNVSSETILAKWNNDNLPHSEAYYPSISR